jgi:hypothetical protein
VDDLRGGIEEDPETGPGIVTVRHRGRRAVGSGPRRSATWSSRRPRDRRSDAVTRDVVALRADRVTIAASPGPRGRRRSAAAAIRPRDSTETLEGARRDRRPPRSSPPRRAAGDHDGRPAPASIFAKSAVVEAATRASSAASAASVTPLVPTTASGPCRRRSSPRPGSRIGERLAGRLHPRSRHRRPPRHRRAVVAVEAPRARRGAQRLGDRGRLARAPGGPACRASTSCRA